MNKDFLKQVLCNEKRLLALKEVKWINVPLYDELSVVNLYPDLKADKEFMQFFPDKLPKGRLPERVYFFNILNTVQEDYVAQLLDFANRQRNDIVGQRMQEQTMVISEDWYEKLNAVPFVSSKLFLRSDSV